MSWLQGLVHTVRESKGLAHKKDIAIGMDALASGQPCDSSCLVGDDCAVLKSADGSYLLFAIEGFMNEFVQDDPWFAGYCGVMVNVSDIAAMGGRATAVVDAVWTSDSSQLKQILQGMAVASARYNVPIVGGHTNARNDRNQLAVSIIGTASQVLSSFAAKPGDVLMSVIDLRGNYQGYGNNWNASTHAPEERLRADLELLPQVAESGLAVACKDISMAGPLGTTLMMLECSGCGAEIWPDSFPRPEGVSVERWMQTFPSFGFVFSVAPSKVEQMKQLFKSRDLFCQEVGQVVEGPEVWLKHQREYESEHESEHEVERALLWDFSSTTLLGCSQLNNANDELGEAYASGSI
ncbi:MAG: sll0787 family AIR synthase-like protein [Limnobacter sp.]|nr:sll0787 family AIR synthase-like protein [Limnobacter sp.]